MLEIEELSTKIDGETHPIWFVRNPNGSGATFASREDAELFVRAKNEQSRQAVHTDAMRMLRSMSSEEAPPLWRNYTEQYTSITMEDFVAKAREAAKEIVFAPPLQAIYPPSTIEISPGQPCEFVGHRVRLPLDKEFAEFEAKCEDVLWGQDEVAPDIVIGE